MASNGPLQIIDSQLNYLFAHSPHELKVERMWSSYNGLIDRFTLLIPYCLDYIRWDVIFNVQCPLAAPDIIFATEDEKFRPFNVSSERENGSGPAKNALRDWNHKDPSRLLSLIHELREEYISYQRKCVGEVDDERVKFEISTFLPREGFEMHLRSGIEKPEEVKFAVPLLDMDLNKMVIGCTWKQKQKIFLQVIFPVGKKHSSTCSAPQLKLVPSSELKVLFSIEDVKLPLWSDGMCMTEYLPILEEILEGQILDAVSLIEVRRRFLDSLGSVFGRPLEADLIFCRKASFFAASGFFTFLVQVSIPAQFPKQQPLLMLQSLQHCNSQGGPIKSPPTLSNFPWSPRWEPLHMAQKIFEFLVDECLNFRKYCNELKC